MSHFLILSALYLGANLRVAVFSMPAAKSQGVASRATSSYLDATIAILIGMSLSGNELSSDSASGLFLGSALAASVTYCVVV